MDEVSTAKVRLLQGQGDRIRLGCVGRLSAQKNQKFALKVLKHLQHNSPSKYCIYLIGDGEDREELESLCVDYGLDADDVIFAGYQPNVAAWYAEGLDVVLIPSVYEGQCRVAAEAQFFGLPVLASDVLPSTAYLAKDVVTVLGVDCAHHWAEAIERVFSTSARCGIVLERSFMDSPLSKENSIKKLISLLRS